MTRFGLIFYLFMRASMLQKKRAALTIAAIAWGTVAIVLLLAFGEGLKNQLITGRRGMGENIAVIWPGETSKPWKGLPAGRAIRPMVDDVAYLRARLPEADGLIGEITEWGVTLSYGRKSISGRVNGTSCDYGALRNHMPVMGGRFLNPIDDAEKRRVVFLGDKIAKDIFGDEDPVGKTLTINDSPYLVVGVMRHKLQMGAYKGPDDSNVVVPISTFVAQFGRQTLTNVLLHVRQPDDMQRALKRFNEVLGAKYMFDPEDPKVVQVWDTVKTSKVMANVTIGIQIFLGLIGGLTLLIGGIGVANIMYAVVKEKTREIGVQMALGARRAWITGPFVLQGLIYTVLGGAWGMVIAIVVIILLGFLPTGDNMALQLLGKPTLSWQIGLATASILGVIGTLAGYFPARRAAGIDPAETLRYE
ncbi:MAG: ABC transporter permease [Acidobacteriota bacterium]